MYTKEYAVRNTQVAASLLQACSFAVIKPISGYVPIACSGLMITILLQVACQHADLMQVDFQEFNFHSRTCSSLYKYQITSSLIFTDSMKPDDKLATACINASG